MHPIIVVSGLDACWHSGKKSANPHNRLKSFWWLAGLFCMKSDAQSEAPADNTARKHKYGELAGGASPLG